MIQGPPTSAPKQAMDASFIISLSANFKNITIHLGPCPNTGALSSEEGNINNDIKLNLKIYGVPSMDIKALVPGFPIHPMYFG